ncbi:FIG00512629: secreted protein [[Actinomadura] parvosata subsp. kistnae]|uniref:DUF4350 domain-containing protein n=1 Tax=[Actinomadura] parvosata subsp. kistnae TaxID=1909395 RepID=A0A1V0A8Q3_9ACTN|nr:DUF4350 domain-containing protein [Nonomuraea sp. ATCC 55076]AQZ66586.1 hypothetical protein BKM31_38635 [Nonomuraea sp. ATCC 55076]SPL95335.1 FIG00512629: secreted protein [Actinomadura parvosata subsp. kistnae]
MSVAAPQSPPGQSYPTSPTARSAWRSSRMIVLLGGLVVLIAVLGVLLGPAPAPARYLDPDDTSLSGSKALAELLRDRGVTVDRVDSVEAAAAKAATGNRLLLVTDTTYVDELALARIPGDRVIVGGVLGLEALAPGVRTEPEQARTRSREPECALPAATAAGSAYLGGLSLRGPSGATACYPAGDGHTLVSFPYASGVITVVGDGGFMTNQRLAEDGNAALALNLIGTGKPVTWLVRPATPPPLDLPGERGKSMYDLMPGNIRWAVYMAIIAVIVTAFWRGRRLGPVVTEKLPVIVRASETVEGRGRLYRARRARERAADALRAGTIDRLTPRLGLASGAGRHEIVAALAARTGQDAQQVGAALYGPPPADDAGLVGLAGYLDFMERQISEL